MTDLRQLAAPFDPAVVQWRVGSTNKDKTSGMALAFIDARAVQQRFDDVIGPGGWCCHYHMLNETTICTIGVWVDGQWIHKSDGARATDFEAEKGALSSAFKRAAVPWGVGRYLYDLPAPWVQLRMRGNHPIIPDDVLLHLKMLLAERPVPLIGAPTQAEPPPPGPLTAPRTPETPAGHPQSADPGAANAELTHADYTHARDAYYRIHYALRPAGDARAIHDILRLPKWDLDLLRQAYPDSHARLLDLSDMRLADFTASEDRGAELTGAQA